MGWNPVKEAEKKAKREVEKVIKSTLEPVAKKIKREFINMGDSIRGGLKKRGREMEQLIDSVGDKAEENIRKAGEEIEDGLTEKLPELAEEALDEVIQALAQAITKEGLQTVRNIVEITHREMSSLANRKPELVAEIDKLGGHIELGPVTLEYDGFYTRTNELTGVLDSYINSPPQLRRSEIIAMVKALGPSSVDLGISVQVVALVVGSKELGIGGGVNSIGIGLFAEIGDAILEEIGVPE